MNVDNLIERSPMQSIFSNLRGGLNAGQVGGVMARAGVGKSAFLIHIALNHLLRGANVLHISLTDSHPTFEASMTRFIPNFYVLPAKQRHPMLGSRLKDIDLFIPALDVHLVSKNSRSFWNRFPSLLTSNPQLS
jgi:KaiC/GvpD/RAD55 family RecA-like ATPase